MKLSIAFSCALALGVITRNSDAFTISSNLLSNIRMGSAMQPLRVGSWENDSFLDGLSRPQESLPQMGDDSNADAGMDDLALPTGTFPPVTPQYGEKDPNQGGTRFQEMVKAAEAAKAAGKVADRPLGAPPMYTPFVPPNTSAAAATSPTIDTPIENMSVEEQAAMFRSMMQNQGAGAHAPPPRAAPMMQGGLDAKGRKIGRNRDADTIANTSDLYFAQLKRDSSIRTMARIEGDDEYAEKVFADPSVKELDEQLKVNPYLARTREESKSLLEGYAEEMMEKQIRHAASQPSINDTGPKYKDILAKKKGISLSSKPAVAPPPPSAVAPPPPPAPRQLSGKMPLVMEVSSSPPDFSSSPLAPYKPPPVETDEMRADLRQLQGMFLKHRGGVGFGSGLLRDEEAAAFEETLTKVGTQLRKEADMFEHKPLIPPAPRPTSSDMAMYSPPPALETTLECVEGAVRMYKNSPPQLQTTLLGALSATIMAAANAVSQEMDGTSVNPPVYSENGQEARLEATLECVDGAVRMYRNSPPQMQSALLGALRAALLAAASSVSRAQQGEVVVDSKSCGNDPNTVRLVKVHEALQNAAGEGRFGLGPISAAEASDLADELLDMRDILMQELSSGIPEDSRSVASVGGSTSSNYQEMLAKARAKKNSP